MNDLISRRAAIQAIDDLPNCKNGYSDVYDKMQIIATLEEVPFAEKLTDAEQRIFLAAMGRERKLCKELPRNDWLLQICDAIERKVKSTLWTI